MGVEKGRQSSPQTHTLSNQFLSQCHTCLSFGVGIRLTRHGACCLKGQLPRTPGDSADKLPRQHCRKHQALPGPPCLLPPESAAGHFQAITCHLELIVLFIFVKTSSTCFTLWVTSGRAASCLPPAPCPSQTGQCTA